MKVREIIEIAEWVDGSGYSYESVYSNQAIAVSDESVEDLKKNFNWNWWEKSEPEEGKDLKITVKYYSNPEYDPMFDDDEPIAVFETWESEIAE